MITSIAAFYLFQESLSKLDILSLVCGFLGVSLILLPKADNNSHQPGLLEIMLIVTLPFQMSTLQLFIRQMKTVHFSVINFYYTLVSALV